MAEPWYTHTVYLDGMTNYGRVVGNWFGDQRVFGDGVGRPQQHGAARLGAAVRRAVPTALPDAAEREVQRSATTNTYQDFSLAYSRPARRRHVGGEVKPAGTCSAAISPGSPGSSVTMKARLAPRSIDGSR